MKPLLPLLLAFAAVPAVAPAAAQAGSPIFSYGCVDSHVGRFDPIVAPGKTDVGHEHMFSGNWTTNPNSTYSSMVGAASLNPGTTCVAGDDQKPATVAQWIPTLRDAANGDKLIGLSSNTVYYVPGKVSASNPDIINPVPANLKLIADMSKGALYGAGWHCGDATPPSKGGTLSATTIPDCNNRDDGRGGVFPDDTRLQAKLVFPDCLKVDSEGKPVLDSPDHRSHAAYSGSAGCPSTHPYIIPRINHKNQFETFGGPGTDLRLASDTDGDDRANDGDSMHSDYWNTWQQSEHQRRVKRCLHDAETYDTSKPPCGSTDIMKGAENPSYPNYSDTGGGTNPEPEPTPAACEDGTDNDNDGKVDLNDPGCSSSTDTDETDPAPQPTPAQCQDGRDNDGDGKIDMNDRGCSGSADDDETDPVTEPSASDWSPGLALTAVGGVAPPAKAAGTRACSPVMNPYGGTRYKGVDLRRIRATRLLCHSARRVARRAHRKGLGLSVPPSGVRRFTWNGWRVSGDLRGSTDRYIARRDGRRVSWQF